MADLSCERSTEGLSAGYPGNKTEDLVPGHSRNETYSREDQTSITGRKSSLDRHLMKHTGDKPYMCGECEYRTKSTLDYHLLKHTGAREKPYMCGECGYRAAKKCTLSQHMRTHTAHKSSLDHHLTKHIGDKPYMCGECGYRTTHKCDQCDYTSAQKAPLDDPNI
ncbi:zinc finger protein 501-like [Branchiostoma floridae]|uniref:Zinc finger protein 501-like n=1 Tax=Branchiostoma floridae TaxID=7739 RepID=A0A9J7HTK8_BRAFL|nr:zinc finger protein 501-like [Branchiostoma floridae]